MIKRSRRRFYEDFLSFQGEIFDEGLLARINKVLSRIGSRTGAEFTKVYSALGDDTHVRFETKFELNDCNHTRSCCVTVDVDERKGTKFEFRVEGAWCFDNSDDAYFLYKVAHEFESLMYTDILIGYDY